MVASPGGKIGPVYELGQRFSVGELCYVRQLFWAIHENLMTNYLVSPTRESGCTRTRPKRCGHSGDTGCSRYILECPQPNSRCPNKQNDPC